MSSTDELYQQMILDHNRNPHNFGEPSTHTHMAEGDNPLCGDHYTVFLTLAEDGTLASVAFSGSGCAISKASASLMTDAVTGRTVDEVTALYDTFHDVVLGKQTSDEAHKLGKLSVFGGIWQYPSRVKCAILCWHALRAALESKSVATTEED